MSQTLQIETVKKIILSPIEKEDFGMGEVQNRAVEIYTDSGKLLIILSGEDLNFYEEKNKTETGSVKN